MCNHSQDIEPFPHPQKCPLSSQIDTLLPAPDPHKKLRCDCPRFAQVTSQLTWGEGSADRDSSQPMAPVQQAPGSLPPSSASANGPGCVLVCQQAVMSHSALSGEGRSLALECSVTIMSRAPGGGRGSACPLLTPFLFAHQQPLRTHCPRHRGSQWLNTRLLPPQVRPLLCVLCLLTPSARLTTSEQVNMCH